MSKDNGYKNIIIAGVWPTKNGHFSTMPMDAKAYDALSGVVEHGGKFLIRKRSEESVSKSKNPDRAPPYYLEFVPAEAVAEFEAQKSQNKKDWASKQSRDSL